jgi:ATPase family protein associated with various cellular activities (AAA)
MKNNSLNLEEIDQEQASQLIKFYIQSQQSCFIFGKVGTGKTAISMQAIKECGYKINYINLSVLERFDLAGLPILDNSDTVKYKSPHFLPKLIPNTQPDTVILFDEIDKVSPEITAPLLEILLFKTINGVPLNVSSCILTGNLMNERAYSNQISSALLDRGAKYILSFSFDRWVEWCQANNIHDLILGFLRSNPNFACSDNDKDEYAFPSPRSWTFASQALLKAKELKILDIDSVIQIISGYVGKEAGLNFKIWYQHYRRFEPFIHSLIERGEMQINFSDLLPTEKLVFVVSACYYVKQKLLEKKIDKKKFVYLERLIKFFNNSNVASEMQIMALHNSFSFELIKEKKLYEIKIFFDHFTKLNEGVKIK